MHLSEHPVAQLIRTRRDRGTSSGRHGDGAHLALAIEGGGMRGVVAGGMAAGLEQMGLTRCFDSVVGTSAGAIVGAFFIARQAGFGCAVYYDRTVNRRFIRHGRLLRGKTLMDVDSLVRETYIDYRPLDFRRVIEDPLRLHCLATELPGAQPRVFCDFHEVEDVQNALLASSRVPWVAGPPVEIAGRRFVDGTLIEPLPLNTALELGATHILCLQTRTARARPRRGLGSTAVERYLRSLDPALAASYRAVAVHRVETYRRIEHATAAAAGPPYVAGIRPSPSSRSIHHLDRSRDRLFAGAAAGVEAAYAAMTGTTPAVYESIWAVSRPAQRAPS
jgi:predicted patatin/cPLA2 family phospholipase